MPLVTMSIVLDASVNSLKNLTNGSDLGSGVPDDTKSLKTSSPPSVDPHIEIRMFKQFS